MIFNISIKEFRTYFHIYVLSFSVHSDFTVCESQIYIKNEMWVCDSQYQLYESKTLNIFSGALWHFSYRNIFRDTYFSQFLCDHFDDEWRYWYKSDTFLTFCHDKLQLLKEYVRLHFVYFVEKIRLPIMKLFMVSGD